MKYYEGHEQEYRRRLQAGHVAWDAGAYEAFDMLPTIEKFLAESRFAAKAPRALDVGCGTGALAVFLAQRGFEVVAVDVAPGAIEEARKQAALRNVNVEFRVADGCCLNLPEASFDLVTDNHFLHCIVYDRERSGVLSKIWALLKPSGEYWIETMVGHPDLAPRPEWNLDEQGITWAVLDEKCAFEGSMTKGGRNWLPIRRIRPDGDTLASELQAGGFEILWRETAPPKDEYDTAWFKARCRKAGEQGGEGAKRAPAG